ncbi:MAG: PQQ-binding-like beta-propeller repeat protein [Lacipirellulaceae bacterium]
MIFPWAWIGLLVGARLGFASLDVTDDFHQVATLVSVSLGAFGLAAWYAIRGRGPLWLRFGVFAGALAFPMVFTTLFETTHDGTGAFVGVRWRGATQPDELLEDLKPEEAAVAAPVVEASSKDYPRFLGTGYWAEAQGVKLDPDWEKNPPQELWRKPIGAGWSSFAVVGDLAYTQEQRGEEEHVTCYQASSGDVVWTHSDTCRFDPQTFQSAMGGVGPRATPTFASGRVYTHGGTGIVNCLDATTGERVWSCDTLEEFGATNLNWGASGSPLVVQDLGIVVVNVGAPLGSTEEAGYDSSLVAFDLETGDVRWKSGWRVTSYASPVEAQVAGTRAVLQVNQDFLSAHAVETGKLLWEHPWPGSSGGNANCSQPVPLAEDRFLLTKGYGSGASLVSVRREEDEFLTEPLWTPAVLPTLETKFSNVVVRDGYAYGLDGNVLVCVELESGKVVWKKRRRPSFGFGQILLVGEHLLYLSEGGELVLIDASPEGYRERAALQALDTEQICWNNPVIVGDLLLVRNAVEAVAYRLTLAP